MDFLHPEGADGVQAPPYPERRRWKSLHAARRDDGMYYTKEEWLTYFGIGPAEEELDLEDTLAAALWARAILKEADPQREVQLRSRLAWDVAGQPVVQLHELLATNSCVEGILLEHWQGGSDGVPGNTLRAGEAGIADLKGGTGMRSTMAIEVVATVPHLQVRVRLMSTGGYLRATLPSPFGNVQHLDFHGGAEEEIGEDSEEGCWPPRTTIFELFKRDAAVPLVSLAARGGSALTTFLPRLAPGYHAPLPPPWWRAGIMEQARERAATDARFQGRRRHPLDCTWTYYTFPDWVEHIDTEEWGGPFDWGALVLAEVVWEKECIKEGEDEPGGWTRVNDPECEVADAKMEL